MTDAKQTKFYTGVTLDPDVAEILSAMTGRTRFNRSRLINTIVREYTASLGQNVIPALPLAGIRRSSQ